jgi:ADP-ribose pyrophosphatase YjhB (NUDIX family)
MKNFPVQVDGREFWISRSVSVEGFIFTKDNGIRILANKRGKGCPNNVGKWNCPCGYLDYDETIKQACTREVKEETNLTLDPSSLQFLWIDSNPRGKTQNISVAFWSYKDTYSYQTVTGEFGEPDEVDEVEWIGLDELENYDWAFEHNYSIMRIALMFFSEELTDAIKRRFEEQLKERSTLGTDA